MSDWYLYTFVLFIFRVVIEELYINDKSYINCQMVLSKNDSCGLSLENSEDRIKMKKATVITILLKKKSSK